MKVAGKVWMMMLLVAASVNPGLAQDSVEGEKSPAKKDEMRIGIKLGANYANVYDEEGNNFVADKKPGFAGGGFVYLPIVRFVGFQPEFLFSQKGFSGSGTLDGERYDLERTTSHFDVPLMLGIKPFSFITILAGPHYSYLINQRDKFTSPNMNVQVEQEFDNDNIRKNTMGAIAGVDLNLLKFVVSARAGWDMTSNRGDGTSETPRYKNMWVQGTIGIRF